MKLKTIQDIQAAAADQYISTEHWDGENYEMICPFCEKRLVRHSEGWGRDKFTWYDDCSCELSSLARKHNEKASSLEAKAKETPSREKPITPKTKEAKSKVISGPKSFLQVIDMLKEKGVYVDHRTFGDAVSIDGIMYGYSDNMQRKLVVIDDKTDFRTYNWDLSVSFMTETGTNSPLMRVLDALSMSGRPFQHVVVSDLKKARDFIEKFVA